MTMPSRVIKSPAPRRSARGEVRALGLGGKIKRARYSNTNRAAILGHRPRCQPEVGTPAQCGRRVIGRKKFIYDLWGALSGHYGLRWEFAVGRKLALWPRGIRATKGRGCFRGFSADVACDAKNLDVWMMQAADDCIGRE